MILILCLCETFSVFLLTEMESSYVASCKAQTGLELTVWSRWLQTPEGRDYRRVPPYLARFYFVVVVVADLVFKHVT